MYFDKTIGNLFMTLVSGLAVFGLENIRGIIRVVRGPKTTIDFYLFLALLAIMAMISFGSLTYKTLRLYFKYRDISKDIHRIGEALLRSLIKAGVIKANNSELKVETSVDIRGSVFCHLEGGTTFDKSMFINALQEIVAPIDNPRYVIIRKSRFLFFIMQKDFHSVPEILGRNKQSAEYFKEQWQRLVGACNLIYTRTIKGRKLILKARVKSLAAQFDDHIEHVNKWR